MALRNTPATSSNVRLRIKYVRDTNALVVTATPLQAVLDAYTTPWAAHNPVLRSSLVQEQKLLNQPLN